MTLFNNQMNNVKLNQVSEQLAESASDANQRAINVKFPFGTNLTPAKGDGVTDDYPAISAIINYALANNLRVIFPTATYLLSQPLTYNDSIHLTLEGGDKENCKLYFTCSTGIQFMCGVVKMSGFQILADPSVQSTFQALQLGDTNVADANDSLHWSKFSNMKISWCNQGIKIGNFFDSSLEDIDIIYLRGTNPVGVNFVQGNSASCASNNLLFNRLHIEDTTDNGVLLKFDQGVNVPTANFVFNGCHFEAHRYNSTLISLNNCTAITFISCQVSHSGATGETVEANYKPTFIFNNVMSIKFIACGIGGGLTTSVPISNASTLISLIGYSRYMSFDNCQISPPYQPTAWKNSYMFNVDVGFTGEYPDFVNCMVGDNTHTLDRFIQGFSTYTGAYNKMYMGMGSDNGLHVSTGKWSLSSTPDDANNYTPFSTFMQNGMFKTAGILGRHSGTLVANTGVKVIAYNGRSGNNNSGLYFVNVLTAGGNAYSAIVAFNVLQSSVSSVYLGTVFSLVKDTAGKVNIYSVSGQINIQNTLTQDVTYSIVPFFIS